MTLTLMLIRPDADHETVDYDTSHPVGKTAPAAYIALVVALLALAFGLVPAVPGGILVAAAFVWVTAANTLAAEDAAHETETETETDG